MATGSNYPTTPDAWADKQTDDQWTPLDANQRTSAIENIETFLTSTEARVDTLEAVFIQSQDASNSASIDFTSIASTYKEYIICFTDVVPVTNGANFYVRASQGSGFLSGASDYQWIRYGGPTSIGVSGDAQFTSDGADSQFIIAADVGNTNAGYSASGELRIFNPAGTTRFKMLTWMLSYVVATGPAFAGITGHGFLAAATSAVDGISFLMSTGNISSGTFKLYGVRAS